MDEKEAEARPIMGTIFLVNIYISREISIEHPSVGLASLAHLYQRNLDSTPQCGIRFARPTILYI